MVSDRQPQPHLEPLLLTAHEAARILRISERLLWGLTQRGEIPVVRIGRAVRYARQDLEAWIARRRQTGTGPAAEVRPNGRASGAAPRVS